MKYVVFLISCCTVSVSAYVHGLLQELLDEAHWKIERQQQKRKIMQIAMVFHSKQLSSERCTNHCQWNTTVDLSGLWHVRRSPIHVHSLLVDGRAFSHGDELNQQPKWVSFYEKYLGVIWGFLSSHTVFPLQHPALGACTFLVLRWPFCQSRVWFRNWKE